MVKICVSFLSDLIFVEMISFDRKSGRGAHLFKEENENTKLNENLKEAYVEAEEKKDWLCTQNIDTQRLIDKILD